MWAAIFLGLFVATAVAFWAVHFRQRGQIHALTKARQKIENEETRVFDFLHGLGAALTEANRPADLHAVIVEGALRVLDGGGGALYRAQKPGGRLTPQFISGNCPPFFEMKAEEWNEPGFSWHTHVRQHTVALGDGVLGAVWRDQQPLLLAVGDPRLETAHASPLKTTTAMLCPLRCGEQQLGVLVIARGDSAGPFLPSELEVFKTIAEQSAIALLNAMVFSDAAEKRRLDEDLLVAQEIQRILLPSNSPDIPGYHITGMNLPARMVSGDYFDYIRIDETRSGIAIADVSGKGVPASLMMAMCRSVLRAQAPGQTSPSAALREVNAQLFPDIREDMFISMAYVVLDRNSSTVSLCRAGHDAPLLYRASDGTVSRINPPGMAVGIDSGGVFNRITGDFSLTLAPGDCLILYTDGITEALDSAGDEYGIGNMIQSIQASAPEGAAGIMARLTGDVRKFVGNHPQHDDITLIVIQKQ